MKRKFIQVFAFIMASILFISCPLSVYASEKWEGSLGLTLYYNKDAIIKYVKDTGQFWLYGASQMGAIVKSDFVSFAENYKKMDEILEEEKDIGVYVNENDEMKGLFFSKEFMAQLKALLDEYAKTEQTKEENGGFYLLPTTNFDDVPADHFANSKQYQTFRRIVSEKGVLAVRTKYYGNMYFADPFSTSDHSIFLVGESSFMNRYINNPDLKVGCNYYCIDCWKKIYFKIKAFPDQDQIYTSCSEAIDANNGASTIVNNACINSKEGDDFNFTIYSTTGEKIRVFVSENAAKNYSLDKRKVYFTKEYYNYVPEDLTVSIDDLQKSVDDLQKIIEELLKKINNSTSEKEIEELLRQILEEIRNNPGGGSGGSGSGDVTVSVDLKETNSWLSKIYNRLGDALDKINDSIDDLKQTLVKYLKTITSDLDDIKGQLENMSEEEFNDKSDSFLDSATESFSEIGEVAKTKFPFSIPNDMKNFLSVLAQTSPEAAGLYSVETSGISLYSDEHGGGGASRPGSDGFIYVEHGGHGGGGVSREPAEVVNGAPVFALPIVIERYGIEEYVIIDMAPFEPVSKLSRSLFTMMFMLCLFNLTFKVMGLWGDLVND